MDTDLDTLPREQLIAEVRKLRSGIRKHRDSTGQDLCWHHPALWGLLPEQSDPIPAVPAWPQFMEGCVRYRASLDRQAPDHAGAPAAAARTDELPPLPHTPPGRYRHYKGGEYEVTAVARHSETHEALVVYRPLDHDTGWWVRPHAMFFEQVEVAGQLTPRFRLVPPVRAGSIP